MECITIKEGFYPLILAPKLIIPDYNKQILPTELGIFKVEKPSEPKYKTAPGDTLAGICMLLMWICIPFGIMMTIFVEDKDGRGGGIFMLVISVAAFLFYKLQQDWEKSTESENNELRTKYSNALMEWKNYQNKLQNVQAINSDMKHLSNLYASERTKAIKKIVQHTNFISKKGISEYKFINKVRSIINELNNEVYHENPIEIIDNGAIIPLYHFPNSEKYRPYQPDILIRSKIHGLYFDIEIDEPYTFEDKEPIHYIYDEIDSYFDQNRDQEIVESNWIVIRFSEEQIINYPEECISFIFQTIDFFDRNPQKSFNEFVELISTSNLPLIKRWSKSDSLNLSKTNYREKYLKLDLFNSHKQKVQSNLSSSSNIRISNKRDDIYNAVVIAIENNWNIQFDYHKSLSFSDGARSKRTIKPSTIERIGVSESLCLRGHCYLRNEERVFTIARIDNLILNPSEILFFDDLNDK